MRKILASIILVLCMCLPSFSQARQTRGSLQLENAILRARVDSLRSVLDSILLERQPQVEEIAVEPESDEAFCPSYSPDQADSLARLWFESNKSRDFEQLSCSLMDSVRFTSDVPDSVMMRRLIDMNPFFTLPFNETVKNYMIRYSERMPSKMGRILGLSRYYFPIFEEVLAKYGLPLEIKYMAVVESMLSPTATSRVGAKGMWQFMPRTAGQYGLRIDSFVDERMDVGKSMDAAARYLKDAYNVFGDWNLAISAYNCGIGNVIKALRRAGGSSNFWDVYTYLPRETRGYVPAIVGVMYAMNYSREYGIEPTDVGMPAQTDTFEIRKNLHFRQINEVVGIPVEDLRTLNPQYYQDIIPGNSRTCILSIPVSWSASFMDAEPDSLYGHKSSVYISEQVLKGIEDGANPNRRVAYKVRSGDYLGRIAQRYHVSVKDIMKWNHLRSTALRAGQVLYVYPSGKAPSSAERAPAGKSDLSNFSGHTIYTVKSGDTFYSIAKNYSGVSAQNIMDYNGVTSSSLRPGMQIKIPTLK